MKKIVSLFMVVFMLLTMLPLSVFAANETKDSFALTGNSVVVDGSEDKTVTVVFSSTVALQIVGINGSCDTAPAEGISLTEFTVPWTVNATNVANVSTGKFSYADDSAFTGFNSAAGASIVTMTYTVDKNTVTGEYPVKFTLAAYSNETYMTTFQNAVANQEYTATISVTNTSGGSSSDGYTATLSTTSSNNEVVSEGSINVNVAVSHSSDTVFNAGEIKLTYDSTKLTPNTTSLDAMVSAGTLSGYKVNNNELVIEYFGGDKTMPYTYAIPFTAAEVSTQTTDTVTLTRAAFIHKNNASSSDLIEATKSPESLTVTIKVAMVNVTLTNSADSTETTTTTTQKGVAYTFTPADTANYTYSDVTATVGGQEVEVKDNGNGTFTIAGENVTGDIAITYTKSPNNYNVHWDGDGAGDITDKPTTATYGQTLTVTLPADKAPGTEAGYTYGISAKIGENSVGTYDSDTRTLTINGTDITGDITIIVTKTTQSATDVTITVAGDSALSIKDATGNTTTVAIGGSVTLVLTEEVGYDYKVVDSNGDEVTFTNGEYTFTASTSETYTATKTLDVSSVKVTEYVKVDSYVVYLVTYDGTLADNKAPTYDGNLMFWSDSYDAYCWLVIDSTLTVDTAKEKINAQSGTATKVDYGMDINGTGTTDAADAQLVWNMYNALYSDFTTVNMAQFLAADQNATSDDNWGLNVQDAQVIITAILAGNATT